MTEQFMPKVDGKSWRCECGANVFHKPEGEPDIFECNACGAWYTDKESVEARIEEGYHQYDELIVLAKSNPNYRLAVVDMNDNERYWVDGIEYDHCRVVKMEDK
jgi:hypothetical protein